MTKTRKWHSRALSTLIALMLVLSFAVATPALAEVTKPEVAVDPNHAGEEAKYTIEFEVTAELEVGLHHITVDFPAGTTVPESYGFGHITVNDEPVLAGDHGDPGATKVTIPTPILVDPDEDAEVIVIFTDDAGIENPDAGTYTLWVNTSRTADATPVESEEYEIVDLPDVSEYELVVDFDLAYPGIAEDFVPPIKVDEWTNFEVILRVAVEGLKGYEDAKVKLTLVDAPEDAELTLDLGWPFDPAQFELEEGESESSGQFDLGNDEVFVLGAWGMCDEIGDYLLRVELLDTDDEVILDREIPFTVWEEFHTAKIHLFDGWNLISLPLIPLVSDIEVVLGAAGLDDVSIVRHYDGATDTWPWYIPSAAGPLETMEDGKGYWIRMEPANNPATLWIWGKEMPDPPDLPPTYDVVEGWNLIGFKSLEDMDHDLYLGNLWTAGFSDYSVIWGYDAAAAKYFNVYPLITQEPHGQLTPGHGYWLWATKDGTIVPPGWTPVD